MEHDWDIFEVEKGTDLGEETRHQRPQILMLIDPPNHADELINLTGTLGAYHVDHTEPFELKLSAHAEELQSGESGVA